MALINITKGEGISREKNQEKEIKLMMTQNT